MGSWLSRWQQRDALAGSIHAACSQRLDWPGSCNCDRDAYRPGLSRDGTICGPWGTAYLGSGVMRGGAMQGDRLVAASLYWCSRVPGVVTDVQHRSAIDEMVDRTVERFGQVDGLVNNAMTFGTNIRWPSSPKRRSM